MREIYIYENGYLKGGFYIIFCFVVEVRVFIVRNLYMFEGFLVFGRYLLEKWKLFLGCWYIYL